MELFVAAAPPLPVPLQVLRWTSECTARRVAAVAVTDAAHETLTSAVLDLALAGTEITALRAAVAATVEAEKTESFAEGAVAALRAAQTLLAEAEDETADAGAPAPVPLFSAQHTVDLLKTFAREAPGVLATHNQRDAVVSVVDVRRESARMTEELRLGSRFLFEEPRDKTRVVDESFVLCVSVASTDAAPWTELARKWRRRPRGWASRNVVALTYKNASDRGSKGECVACGHEATEFRVTVARTTLHLACAVFVLGTEPENE